MSNYDIIELSTGFLIEVKFLDLMNSPHYQLQPEIRQVISSRTPGKPTINTNEAHKHARVRFSPLDSIDSIEIASRRYDSGDGDYSRQEALEAAAPFLEKWIYNYLPEFLDTQRRCKDLELSVLREEAYQAWCPFFKKKTSELTGPQLKCLGNYRALDSLVKNKSTYEKRL